MWGDKVCWDQNNSERRTASWSFFAFNLNFPWASWYTPNCAKRLMDSSLQDLYAGCFLKTFTMCSLRIRVSYRYRDQSTYSISFLTKEICYVMISAHIKVIIKSRNTYRDSKTSLRPFAAALTISYGLCTFVAGFARRGSTRMSAPKETALWSAACTLEDHISVNVPTFCDRVSRQSVLVWREG